MRQRQACGRRPQVLWGGAAQTGRSEPAAAPGPGHARSGERRSRRSLGGVGDTRRHRLHTQSVQFLGRGHGLRQRACRRQREHRTAVDAHAAGAVRAHQVWAVGVLSFWRTVIGGAGRVPMAVGNRLIRHCRVIRVHHGAAGNPLPNGQGLSRRVHLGRCMHARRRMDVTRGTCSTKQHGRGSPTLHRQGKGQPPDAQSSCQTTHESSLAKRRRPGPPNMYIHGRLAAARGCGSCACAAECRGPRAQSAA